MKRTLNPSFISLIPQFPCNPSLSSWRQSLVQSHHWSCVDSHPWVSPRAAPGCTRPGWNTRQCPQQGVVGSRGWIPACTRRAHASAHVLRCASRAIAAPQQHDIYAGNPRKLFLHDIFRRSRDSCLRSLVPAAANPCITENPNPTPDTASRRIAATMACNRTAIGLACIVLVHATMGSASRLSMTALRRSLLQVESLDLPPLPYATDALEPVISEEIMTLHHNKHLLAYTNGYNAAAASLETAFSSGDAAAAAKVAPALNFNAGGEPPTALTPRSADRVCNDGNVCWCCVGA